MKEIEAKIIEINRHEVETRLHSLGAIHEFTQTFKAAYFDRSDASLRAKGEVLRLRQEGDTNVLTYKYLSPNDNPNIKVREELEVKVDDHATTWKILQGIGFQPTLIMDKTRSQWSYRNAHIVIDQYIDEFAHIPVFLEIEAPSIEDLQAVALDLGFAATDLKNWSAAELIGHYAHLKENA